MPKNEKYDPETVKGRLLLFLKEKRLSQTEFGRILGVAPTYIGAMRKSLSADKVNKLTRAFPDLNRDWILYGEGEMLKEPAEEEVPQNVPDNSTGYLVPMLPVAAYAGNLQMWSEGVDLAHCEKVVSPVKGVDFGIRVSGDSMEPDIEPGSIIFIKKINDKSFIPWGHPMVIDSENGVLVKEVYPSRNGSSFIEARSINPKYPPVDIPKSSIYGLYRVMSSIRVFSTY